MQQFQKSREKGIKHGQNANISALLTGENLRSILEKHHPERAGTYDSRPQD
jgi:hypothetical protein